jgi:hypothetical protein
MIRWLLLRPYRLAEPWLRHSNWMVRRVAQVVAFGVAMAWLALPSEPAAEAGVPARSDALADAFVSSPRMREFLHGNAIGKPVVGHICRLLVLRLSVYAKTREGAPSDDRNFVLRLRGPIDQTALRNLLIWQNHVLPSYLPHDLEADIALVLASGADGDARLLDLFSIALMLERVRSLSVFWDEETAVGTTSVVMSERELSRWRASGDASDLGRMPPDLARLVALHGSHGGVKLLQHGRRYANDFLKLALPGRFIVAIGLRECADGTVESEDLELWLDLIDRLHARHPGAAFVVLNRLAPSQWRQWPAHLRFARHQGLSLQDTICLAQIADGYLGVLDVLGLAAHSAGRPGIYVPLEDGDPPRPESAADHSQAPRIMVGSRDRAAVEAAIGTFGGFAPVGRPPAQ